LPRLAVLLVVDSLDERALEQHADLLTRGGLRRFRSAGHELSHVDFQALPAARLARLGTLATGVPPGRHGIVDDEWAAPPGQKNPGATPDTSPGLQAPTLGDRLRRRYPDAKVVAVALDERPARILGGVRGWALWADDARQGIGGTLGGGLPAPAWTQAADLLPSWPSYRSRAWTSLRPLQGGTPLPQIAARPPRECLGRRFPHPLAGCPPQGPAETRRAVLVTPLADERTIRLALAASEQEGLGQDPVPDLLLLELRSLGWARRIFGAGSPEAEDALLRLDQQLELLLDTLDLQLGAGGYVALLVGGPGGMELQQSIPVGTVTAGELRALVDKALASRHGPGPWVVQQHGGGLALDPARLARAWQPAAEVRADACQALLTHPGIERCFPRPRQRPTGLPEPLLEAYGASFHPARSWDLQAVVRCGWQLTAASGASPEVGPWRCPAADAAPGAAWLLAPGLPLGTTARPVELGQLTATLADWLGLDPTPGAPGPALAELAPPPLPVERLRLTLLHTNDHHGHDLDHPGPRGKGLVGGLGMRAALVETLRRAASTPDRRVLLLDVGDFSTGPCPATRLQARSSLAGMDRLGYDAVAIGNHEFDQPLPTLLGELARITFPVLSATARWRESSELLLPAQHDLELAGRRVAILALTTPETPATSTLGDDPRLRFDDTVATARQWVARLRPERDLLIVLSHQGLLPDLELARQVPGIDVLVGGHSHDTLPEPVREGETLILQAGDNGRFLGRAELELGPDRTVRLLDYELLPVPAAGEGALQPSPEVEVPTRQLWQTMERACLAPVGRASSRFERTPLQGPGTGSTLAHLVADSLRWRGRTQLALQNEGGLRDDLPAGNVTLGAVQAVLPFTNSIVRVELSGAELVAVLDEVARRPPTDLGFLHVSGLSWVIAGGRATQILVGGQPLDPARRYTVATNSFLARGGDGHRLLAELGKRQDTGFDATQALADYVHEKGPVVPDRRPRVVRAAEATPGDGAVPAAPPGAPGRDAAGRESDSP
jgi:5'-nucleotidase/UDP-sugar diphosphatase